MIAEIIGGEPVRPGVRTAPVALPRWQLLQHKTALPSWHGHVSTALTHQHRAADVGGAEETVGVGAQRPLRTLFARRGRIARRRLDARRERARLRALLCLMWTSAHRGAALEQLASHQRGIGTLMRAARRSCVENEH